MKPPNHTTKAQALALLASGAARGVAIIKNTYGTRAQRRIRCILINTIPASAGDYLGVKHLTSAPLQMSVVQGWLRTNRLTVEWSGWVGMARVAVLRWERVCETKTE